MVTQPSEETMEFFFYFFAVATINSSFLNLLSPTACASDILNI
jgi:hypothetical protein